MSSQAAKSPPIQKGQAGHWKSQTRQKTRPLIGSQISAFFFFLKMKLKCSMHPLNLTLEHLARSFCHLTKIWGPALQNDYLFCFSVYLCGGVCKCQNPLNFTAAATTSQQPQRQWWGVSWTPAAGKDLQAAQAPSASEVVWLLPSCGISKTVMPTRKVSSQMLRLFASVPETKNCTY